MRTTRLMQLTQNDTGGSLYGDTSSIDNTVYMLCAEGEAIFGSDFIDAVAEYIMGTQTGMPREQALEFIVNDFIHTPLAQALTGKASPSFVKDFMGLDRLSNRTYTDYFLAFMKLERELQDTPLAPATQDLNRMLAGYNTVTPFAVCQALVNFFKATGDSYGLFLIVKNFCQYIKRESEKVG